MNLLYIALARLPTEKAHGLQIVKMCEAFTKLGINLKLIVPRRWYIQKNLSLVVKNIFDFYSIKKNFPVVRLFCLDFLWLDKYLAPFPYFLLNLSFCIYAGIYSLMRPSWYVYSRSLFTVIILSIFSPRRVIFEMHAITDCDLIFSIYAFFLKKIKAVVVVSDGLKQKLCRFGILSDRILTAPAGFDEPMPNNISKIKSINKAQFCKKNQKLIIYLGSLDHWKGVYTLAESIRYLGLSYKLLIIGGLSHDNSTIEFVKYLKKMNDDRILHIPYMEHEKAISYLSIADCLVLPNSAHDTESKYYTSPLKLLEYISAKRPIVASDLPSIRNILHDTSAVFVYPDDPQALAEGIKKVCMNEKLSAVLVRNASRRVSGRTWLARAQTIVDFINTKFYNL